MVVVHAPTNQNSTEDKDHFHCDLESVLTRANMVTVVMGNFNATVGETVQEVVGSSPTSTSTRLSATFPILGPSQVSKTMLWYDADYEHQSCSWIYTGVQRSGH